MAEAPKHVPEPADRGNYREEPLHYTLWDDPALWMLMMH